MRYSGGHEIRTRNRFPGTTFPVVLRACPPLSIVSEAVHVALVGANAESANVRPVYQRTSTWLQFGYTIASGGLFNQPQAATTPPLGSIRDSLRVLSLPEF